MIDQSKLNDLGNKTEIIRYREQLDNGVREEWHRHPTTGETIIVHSSYVPDGDCVSGESEIVEIIPAGGYLGDLLRMVGEAVKEFKKTA